MTDDELERMRAYAEAAREHPTWSVAYAQDVPKLLAEVERLQEKLVYADEVCRGLQTESNAWHEEHDGVWNRLRFAEMVLDRVGAEIDGVPWREAARLSESLNGEPVTDPVATATLERTVVGQDRLLTEVAASGVEHDDPRMDYVTVQIERDLWERVRVWTPVAPNADSGVQSGD